MDEFYLINEPECPYQSQRSETGHPPKAPIRSAALPPIADLPTIPPIRLSKDDGRHSTPILIHKFPSAVDIHAI